MIIEFPRKYTIKSFIEGIFHVSVPEDKVHSLLATLVGQPWLASATYVKSSKQIICFVSGAYDVSDEQAYDALCKLCEHVMDPPADLSVWEEALSSEDYAP